MLNETRMRIGTATNQGNPNKSKLIGDSIYYAVICQKVNENVSSECD